MTSPHITSSFEFIVLQHSIRASGNPDFQRLKNIAHMHPRNYEDKNSRLIEEVKDLVSRACTFVDNWSSPVITPATCRLYSKKFLQRKLQEILRPKFKVHSPLKTLESAHQEIFKIPKILTKKGK